MSLSAKPLTPHLLHCQSIRMCHTSQVFLCACLHFPSPVARQESGDNIKNDDNIKWQLDSTVKNHHHVAGIDDFYSPLSCSFNISNKIYCWSFPMCVTWAVCLDNSASRHHSLLLPLFPSNIPSSSPAHFPLVLIFFFSFLSGFNHFSILMMCAEQFSQTFSFC